MHWLWMEEAREWEMGMEGLRGGCRERGREWERKGWRE